MKKMTAILLTIALLLSVTPALAAGRISVIQENLITLKDGGWYCYAYAKVENTGNKPIKVSDGRLEVFDAEGNAFASTTSMTAYAQYLEPGEYTYIRMYTGIKEEMSDQVDDYMLTITGKSEQGYDTVRFTGVGEYEGNVVEGSYTNSYMYCTLTNDTDEPISRFDVCFALLDEDDNILYITSDYAGFSNLWLMPGGSIKMRVTVDSDFVAYMEENNIVPASVDVIAYATVKTE